MARTVAVSELKAQCLRLVDEVARRRREIVVTKRGKPIARMVPLDDVPPDAALTRCAGR
jgi:prevent-host-death family protein